MWGACLRLAAANLDMAAEPSRTRNEASELIQRARAAAERSVRAAESPEGAPELERKRASMRQQSALMRAECLSKPVVREAPLRPFATPSRSTSRRYAWRATAASI